MRVEFAAAVLSTLRDAGQLTPESKVLVTCGGDSDRKLFADLGYANVHLTDIDATVRKSGAAEWRSVDAHHLPYDDESFDFVFVSDGLHHCRSPHRALTEMYRTARRGIIVVESRDSFLVRLAVRLGLSGRYEINAVLLETRTAGGVDFGAVPNFIYRWTERELEKLIRSYDPARTPQFEYFYGVSLPRSLPTWLRPGMRMIARGVVRTIPRQGNTFAMVALKPPLDASLQSFLDLSSGSPALRPEITTTTDVRRALKASEEPRRVRHAVRA